MRWPWTVEKKPHSPEEEKLFQIKSIMFPPLAKEKDLNGDMIYIDSTIDMNLHSVITDLEDGYNDETTRDTLRDILKRVEQVRRVLKVLSEFDPDAKYIIVDSKAEKPNLEDIQARD